MAYVFSQINQQLDKDKPQGTDIFATDQGGQNPSQGGEGANPNGTQVKTSTEGDLGAGGGGGASVAAENMPAEMTKQDTRVLKRNMGKVTTPDFTKRMDQQLSDADKALQDEANTYVEGVNKQASTYKIDDKTLDSAVSGDQDAQGKVTGALGAQFTDYEDFAPQTDYQLEELANLDSSQGLEEILRGESRGKLSGKEIAFDRGILEKSPEFIAIKNALKGKQSGLVDRAGKLVEEKTKFGDDTIRGAIDSARAGVETGLTTRQQNMLKAQEDEAAKINETIKQMKAAGVPKEVIAELTGLKEGLAKDFDDKLRLDDILKNYNLDASKYITWRDPVTGSDMIDETEAMKFNNILSLLGKGGDSYVAGKGAGDLFSFDKKKASDAIVSGAQTERKNQDTKLNSEMQGILDAIKAQVGSQNASLTSQYDQQKNHLLGQLQKELGDYYHQIDLNPIMQQFAGPNLYDENTAMTSAQAARLNEILGALGQKGKKYAASNYSKGNAPTLQQLLDLANPQIQQKQQDYANKKKAQQISNYQRNPQAMWEFVQDKGNPYVNPDNVTDWLGGQAKGAAENFKNEVEEAAIKINPFKKNKGPKW